MRRSHAFALSVACLSALAVGCKAKAPAAGVATPSIQINHPEAPAGSPIEITYRFVVAADAPPFKENDTVFVGVVDNDEQLMWTDDHQPPVPTTQWKPGQTIEYTRTVFVPIYPYVGHASIRMGLYSPTDHTRVPLIGTDAGLLAYTVGQLQLTPESDNLPLTYKSGWQMPETPVRDGSVEWQWSKKNATIEFKNPMKDAVFYLELDSPGKEFHGPQQVEVALEGKPVDTFTLAPETRQLRVVKLAAADMGTAEVADIQISVDQSFVPANVPGSTNRDRRELGVRVFHAYIDAR